MDGIMRFAIVGNTAPALVNFRGPLIEDIVTRGHTVFAFAPDFNENLEIAVGKLGAQPIPYRLERTGMNFISDFKDAVDLQKKLKKINADAVLCFGIKPVIFGTIAARLAGITKRFALIPGLGYAFIDSGKITLKRRLVSKIARILYKISLSQANLVFMQNPDDADDFVSAGIVKRDKVVVVNGTGVRLDDWESAAPVLDPVTFMFAGRMLADKGIFEFIDASRIVKERHPAVRIVVLGSLDSNPEAISKSQLESWVAAGLVEWPGHVDIRTWLAQASVFVLPSYREGVPRSSQEAMALGRPVITTDVPGCRQTVVDGVNGFLVPVRQAEALAEAMLRFVENPNLIAQMGRASRAMVEERFDAAKINARMIDAMQL